MNILVIEDDRMTLKAVKFALAQKGHKVFLASNEPNALNQLKQNQIDFIVSDINLPGNPPITEMIEKLKSFDSKNRPIVLISSVLDNPLIDESILKAGASAFIPKPINYQLLTEVIERFQVSDVEAG
jgi:DNA-binding response OmpR family regulator